MPLRKEPPTPRTVALDTRLDPTRSHASTSSLRHLIPLKPGQTSLRKQAILTEDEYTSALSSVIKRDFFPELDKITAENEYLAAVEDEDPVQIRYALNRLLRLEGPETAPSTRKQRRRDVPRPRPASERGEWDDTPIVSGSSSQVFNPTFTPACSTPGYEEVGEDDTAEPPSGITPDLDLSLEAFQARYTSEDNASFSQLLDRDNQQRKRKYAHLYARQRASSEYRKRIAATEQQEARQGKQLAVEANPDHPKLLQRPTPTLLIEGSDAGDKGKQRESATQKDPMDDLILVHEPRYDTRTPATGLNRWQYTARNALMFGPNADEDHLHARHPDSSTESEPKPATNFAALRMPDESAPPETLSSGEKGESETAWSPSSSRVDAAIARGRAGSFTSTLSTTDETPKVNGYGFVTPYTTPQHATPLPPDDDDHLRIYNAIKAKRAAPSRNAFELPQYNKREVVAQKLAANATPKAGGATPYGRAKYTGLAELKAHGFASHKAKRTELTPAGRALLHRSTRGGTPLVGGVASPISRSGLGTRRRVGDRGWTPTPQHTQGRH